ncbi:hypothetical protein JCM12294_41970 [Desulfocicer niacini]
MEGGGTWSEPDDESMGGIEVGEKNLALDIGSSCKMIEPVRIQFLNLLQCYFSMNCKK